jgi:hypothetical protein
MNAAPMLFETSIARARTALDNARGDYSARGMGYARMKLDEAEMWYERSKPRIG